MAVCWYSTQTAVAECLFDNGTSIYLGSVNTNPTHTYIPPNGRWIIDLVAAPEQGRMAAQHSVNRDFPHTLATPDGRYLCLLCGRTDGVVDATVTSTPLEAYFIPQGGRQFDPLHFTQALSLYYTAPNLVRIPFASGVTAANGYEIVRVVGAPHSRDWILEDPSGAYAGYYRIPLGAGVRIRHTNGKYLTVFSGDNYVYLAPLGTGMQTWKVNRRQ